MRRVVDRTYLRSIKKDRQMAVAVTFRHDILESHFVTMSEHEAAVLRLEYIICLLYTGERGWLLLPARRVFGR